MGGQVSSAAARLLLAIATLGAAAAHAQYDATDRVWFRGEYLLWQTNGADLPALVTSSPSTTPLADAGQLGDPSTTILYGNNTVADNFRSGYRLSFGAAIDDCNLWQVIGDYFYLGANSANFSATDTPGTIIARPFFNTEDNVADAEMVSVPDELSGTVRVGYSDQFQGAGAAISNLLFKDCCDCGDCCGPVRMLTVFGGYRYYRLNSNLGITENLEVLEDTSTPLIPGTLINLSDRFAANNEFHGGELGMTGRWAQGIWWLDGLAALAIGSNRRTISIDGSTTNTVPDVGSSTAAGGLLTSSVTNIGHYVDPKTTVIPRFRLGAGVQLTPRWSATAGYNVIIWDGVATAADGLPPGLAVDPRNLPPVQAGGGPDPRFAGFVDRTMTVHGFDAGLTFVY